jgi:hypothetical protein
VQANHQAIASRIPSVYDWLEQVNDYAGNRWSVLILADSDSANLLAGEVDPPIVPGQKRIRQIGIWQIGIWQIGIWQINDQPRWIVQLAYDGDERAAGQDFHRRPRVPRQHPHAADDDRHVRGCQQLWSRLGRA